MTTTVPRHSTARAWRYGVLSAMVSLAEQTNALRDGASREVATLALEIAARIVHEAVAIDGALLERIVQRALVRAKDESRVRLRLHPEDREALIARFADRGGLPAAIQIVDAEGQLRGGCVVSSERISIDARVESAIEAIARAMGVDGPGT